MEEINHYLELTGEIGFVEEVVHSIAYISGLPLSRVQEVVVFESGGKGLVLSLQKNVIEVLLLSNNGVRVGEKVARTGDFLKIGVGTELLGKVIDPMGFVLGGGGVVKTKELRLIDVEPQGILQRELVTDPLETGVTIVDLVCPLGKGQRELIIGDRKTGKTQFLQQSIISQASKGAICIYAVIGQRYFDIKKLEEYFKAKGVSSNTIIVGTSSSDSSGLIFLTPYSAMTIAEYFRDKGMDVLIILDDLTSHARCYREISLLGKRFPGRGSYPGDIFYTHSKLIERAGKFKKGSISCFPVAESVLGDLSGYIQTNLMAMTDGHVFFDIDLYNQGKRPSVSPFLSVTRVGHQTQTNLKKDLSREMSSFLINLEKMKQFMHFGSEVGENLRRILKLGEKIDAFFNQPTDRVIPSNINILIATAIWAGIWSDVETKSVREQMDKLISAYETNERYRKDVDKLIESCNSFSDILTRVKENESIIRTFL